MCVLKKRLKQYVQYPKTKNTRSIFNVGQTSSIFCCTIPCLIFSTVFISIFLLAWIRKCTAPWDHKKRKLMKSKRAPVHISETLDEKVWTNRAGSITMRGVTCKKNVARAYRCLAASGDHRRGRTTRIACRAWLSRCCGFIRSSVMNEYSDGMQDFFFFVKTKRPQKRRNCFFGRLSFGIDRTRPGASESSVGKVVGWSSIGTFVFSIGWFLRSRFFPFSTNLLPIQSKNESLSAAGVSCCVLSSHLLRTLVYTFRRKLGEPAGVTHDMKIMKILDFFCLPWRRREAENKIITAVLPTFVVSRITRSKLEERHSWSTSHV